MIKEKCPGSSLTQFFAIIQPLIQLTRQQSLRKIPIRSKNRDPLLARNLVSREQYSLVYKIVEDFLLGITCVSTPFVQCDPPCNCSPWLSSLVYNPFLIGSLIYDPTKQIIRKLSRQILHPSKVLLEAPGCVSGQHQWSASCFII